MGNSVALDARVIKLASLADDDGVCANHENALTIGTFWNAIVSCNKQ
jgi:hypothetical protein